MDGEGGAEYTRDPALLSPNDPHQSTSTNTQTRETQNTLSYGSQHTHHPAHKYTKRSETVEDKTRPSSVNECSLLYPVSVCLSLCSVDSYSCPLLSSTTQSYQGTHYTAPLLTLAMNLQVHSTYFHHGKTTTVGSIASFLYNFSPSDHYVLLVVFC